MTIHSEGLWAALIIFASLLQWRNYDACGMILCTCRVYLLLIHTQCTSDNPDLL